MNRREKILVICLAAAMGAIVLYGAVQRLLIGPGQKLAQQIQGLNDSGRELKTENSGLSAYKSEFAALRDSTFDDNRRSASVMASARISQLARTAGLGEGDYTLTKFAEQRLRDAGWELICTINANTSLDRMVNLLYLLGQDEHLHRVSSLTITPQSDKRLVRFSLRYSTLVLADPKLEGISRRPTTTQPVQLASLNDPKRGTYDAIMRRHVFLPYVPRPAPTPRPVQPSAPRPPQPVQPPVTPPPPPQPYDQYVVVGLPSRGPLAEVHVARPGTDIKEPLKVGDRLATGQIAMVDYRVLPMPGNPKELSQSRVILRIGKDYWAVELGQRIDQRRVLRTHELPEKLKPKPSMSKTGSATPSRSPGPARGRLASSQPARKPSPAEGDGG